MSTATRKAGEPGLLEATALAHGSRPRFDQLRFRDAQFRQDGFATDLVQQAEEPRTPEPPVDIPRERSGEPVLVPAAPEP